MMQKLLDVQERLEPHLLPGYYSFIGPVNQNNFEHFIHVANNVAPVVAFSRSIHHVLSNKEAVQRALRIFSANEPLRLYVIQNSQEDILLHDTVKGYCEKNNIDFTP
jgi:hypothetical protein